MNVKDHANSLGQKISNLATCESTNYQNIVTDFSPDFADYLQKIDLTLIKRRWRNATAEIKNKNPKIGLEQQNYMLAWSKYFLLSIIFFTHIVHLRTSECPAGKYPVRSHLRTDYYRHDGTYLKEASVNKNCREYRSKKNLKIKFSIGVPKDWPHKKEKFRGWSDKEKNELTKALNELPAILTQIGELKVFRAFNSEATDNPATSAPLEKIITLYDIVT